ncbi:hypothetical protein EV368DRAFT_68552 [Lentinula lateritia]|nr:hypothetical protein EV368DRAFT_68552 [Lentinula lateritia]
MTVIQRSKNLNGMNYIVGLLSDDLFCNPCFNVEAGFLCLSPSSSKTRIINHADIILNGIEETDEAPPYVEDVVKCHTAKRRVTEKHYKELLPFLNDQKQIPGGHIQQKQRVQDFAAYLLSVGVVIGTFFAPALSLASIILHDGDAVAAKIVLPMIYFRKNFFARVYMIWSTGTKFLFEEVMVADLRDPKQLVALMLFTHNVSFQEVETEVKLEDAWHYLRINRPRFDTVRGEYTKNKLAKRESN